MSDTSSITQEIPLERLSFEPLMASALTAEAIERGAMQRLAGPAPSALRRLAPAHRACIALFSTGHSAQAIATRLGRSYSWVLQTLADPLAKAILDRIAGQVEREMESLLSVATQVIREQMLTGAPGNKLRAADMVLKANRVYAEPMQEGRTAEDVIQNILSFAKDAMHMVSDARGEQQQIGSVQNLNSTDEIEQEVDDA